MVIEQAPALHLNGLGDSPRVTRAWAREVLLGLGSADLIESAQLGLTELVTNACLHARTAVTVTVIRTATGRLRFEVGDGSSLLPTAARRGQDATTGRGMFLVAACGAWGASGNPDGHGKTVWFEPSAEMAEDMLGWADPIAELA